MAKGTVPPAQFGGGGTEVWGCFSGFGLGRSDPVKDILNARESVHILDNWVLQCLWRQFGEGPLLFQQDCAPVHIAGFKKTWFDEVGVDEHERPTHTALTSASLNTFE